MDSLFLKTLIAVCCANFVAMNFFFFLLYPRPDHGVSAYVELAGLFFTIGVCASFAVTAALGWPLYWMARKIGLVNLQVGLLSGAAIAVIPWGVLNALNWNLPSISSTGGLMALSAVAISGAIGGATFWLVTKGWPHKAREAK